MPKLAPKKVALLIGVSQYEAGLPPLPAAPNDVEAMRRVLQDPSLGGFDVAEPLLNPDPIAMQDAIEKLFAECQKDDLALLFFSGHGITDDNGRLFLTTCLTNEKRFRATSVPASFVHDVMNESPCQRQVVILDCCYSGAFKEGWQARSAGTIDIKQQLALGSKGRAVLTSSNAVQKSFEHEGSGIYTRYLVEGIETGVADSNGNGTISIQELHEYAKEKVQQAKPTMTPEIHTHKEGFNILLAQARRKPEADYRKLVERYASHGEISFVARVILQQKQKDIGITDGLAAEIENQVLEPYRKRLKNLERYREAFKKAVEYRYPLAQKTRDELKDLQDVFGLRDEDVEPIQEQVTADKEAEYQQQQEAQRRQQEQAKAEQQQEVERRRQQQQSTPTTPSKSQEETDELASEKSVDYTNRRDLLAQGNWKELESKQVAPVSTPQPVQPSPQRAGLRNGRSIPRHRLNAKSAFVVKAVVVLTLVASAGALIGWQYPFLLLKPQVSPTELNLPTNPTSTVRVDYSKLQNLLAQGKWKEADKETQNLMLKVAGRENEGRLDDAHIQKLPCTDLRTIDNLWVKHSKGRFGFSVQKRIWESVGGTPDASYEIYERLGDRIKWRVNNDWLYYNSLTFSLEEAAPGHLPAAWVGDPVGDWRTWLKPVENLETGSLETSSLFSRVETCKL